MPYLRTKAVTTAAGNYALTTLANVKLDLGIDLSDATLDAYLNRAITVASSLVANYCKDPIVVETITDTFRLEYDADNWMFSGEEGKIGLSRRPVGTVTSVTEYVSGVGTVLVENTDFFVDVNAGILVRINSVGDSCEWTAQKIVVVYSAGYVAIPTAVDEAVVAAVGAAYTARGRDKAVKSEFIDGVSRVEYFDSGHYTIDDYTRACLDPYRDHSL